MDVSAKAGVAYAEAVLSAETESVESARAYELLHVPALFQEWAPRMLDAASVGIGDRVIDVACGTGVLAREAAVRVGPTGAVVGIDPDYGMIAVSVKCVSIWRKCCGPVLCTVSSH